MRKIAPLEYGKYYHIYNRGINGCEIFREKTNYEHFLRLFEKYIPFIANTYAWVLMGNHFHFLIKIKEENEIGLIPLKSEPLSGHKAADKVVDKITETLSEVENPDGSLKIRKYKPSNQFSHLFNSYTQAFNKKYNRTGSLFENPFHRKEITNDNYFKYLIYYIHHNPVHHDFTEDMIEYPWSSYLTVLSPKKTQLKRQEVIEWFDDIENFKYFHKQQHKLDNIKSLLLVKSCNKPLSGHKAADRILVN